MCQKSYITLFLETKAMQWNYSKNINNILGLLHAINHLKAIVIIYY